MRKYLQRGIALLVMLVTFTALLPTAFAQEQRVFDDAGLFSQSDVMSLESAIETARQEMGMDFVLLTTNDAAGKTTTAYADDYYDENGFGTGNDASGALFLIDMDNREITISTAGKMIRILTDARINTILDKAYDKMVDADYAGAAQVVVQEVRQYAKQGIVSNQYNYDTETGEVSRYRSVSLGQIILFLLISWAAGTAACLGVKAKYQLKRAQYQYPWRENGTLVLANQVDELSNRFVTTRHIPKPTPSSSGGHSSSGGRSSTHRSSSGRSHGGGSRRF